MARLPIGLFQHQQDMGWWRKPRVFALSWRPLWWRRAVLGRELTLDIVQRGDLHTRADEGRELLVGLRIVIGFEWNTLERDQGGASPRPRIWVWVRSDAAEIADRLLAGALAAGRSA